MESKNDFDVLIVGGGVTGASIAFVLTRFTNISRIALLEQYHDVGLVNSNVINNSQTLHSGDIETNFNLEKALHMQRAAKMLAGFLEKYGRGSFMRVKKMVVGVGRKEVEELRKRFREFKIYFPNIQFFNREEIGKFEPKVMLGRSSDEEIVALFSEEGYAVDYHQVAQDFIQEARKSDKYFGTHFNTSVTNVVKEGGGYQVETDHGIFKTKVLVFAAGPYSLLFAHKLGYAEDLSILPVAGSFYYAEDVLNGKVYTVQTNIPFAAVHGDPAVYNPRETRFGPTAKVLPLLERHHYRTFFHFLRTGMLSWRGILTFLRTICDKEIFIFMLKNIIYELPMIGKWLFLQSVRKIVPTMSYRGLHFARGSGGIRPQIVNLKKKCLQKGTEKIVGDRIIFNVTPSPGASNCLDNAVENVRDVINFLGVEYWFEEERFNNDFFYQPAQ